MAQAYLFSCGSAVWFVEGRSRISVRKIGRSLYIHASGKCRDSMFKHSQVMTSQEVLDLLETSAPQLLTAIREWEENR